MGRTVATILKEADDSYISARLLFFNGITGDTPLAAHRALKLYLYALILSLGGDPSGSNLPRLGKDSASYSPASCHLLWRYTATGRGGYGGM